MLAFCLLTRAARAFEEPSNCPAAPLTTFIANGAKLDFSGGAGRPMHILAIGSSSTEGVGASKPELSYPSQLGVLLRAAWNSHVEVLNAGIGGEVGSATLKRLETAVSSHLPDLLIWQVGTNDAVGGAGPTQFRAVVDEGLAAAAAARVPVILIDPQYFPGIKDVSRYEQFVRIISEEAAIWRTPLFSRYAMMKAWGSKSETDLDGMLSKDRFHMGDKGYACLAQALAGDIERSGAKAAGVAAVAAPSDGKSLRQ